MTDPTLDGSGEWALGEKVRETVGAHLIDTDLKVDDPGQQGVVNALGEVFGDVGDSVWKSFTTKGGDLGGVLPLLSGGLTGPAGWASVGLKIFGAMQQNKAIRAEAAERAGYQRRQGEAVMRQAGRHADDVKEEERFKAAEEAEETRNVGFLTGSESISGGTGVSSVFAANRKAAESLANDIMTEARRQKSEYDRAAASTERAAEERTKGNLMGRIGEELFG